MRILFDKPRMPDDSFKYVLCENDKITYISETKPEGSFDRIIDCKQKMLFPGLYNCHTHAAMTLFRGYGADLPLDRWLNEKIFPAEDRLTPRSVYAASMLACAEQIKNGIVSFSDMYFFCDETVKASIESGMRANISRCIVSFDPTEKLADSPRFAEAKSLFETYHNAADGRIKIDMSLHAEYTNLEHICAGVGEYAAANNAGLQIHLSETEKEHNECIGRHGKTPTKFFADAGVFGARTTAAHCVWVTDDDMDIMAQYGVTAAHNPVSNLKLGSGVMPLSKMLAKGINVTLGSDGTASNNTLDILKEMYTAAILHKGIERKCDKYTAADIVKLACENGAKAQGREDCGRIETGCKADLILLDLDAVNAIPVYDSCGALVYALGSSNVCMTMVDGKILYENGEYKTIDIERTKAEMRDVCDHYFD